MSPPKTKMNAALRRILLLAAAVAALVVVVNIARSMFSGGEATEAATATFEVRRGRLPITVVEGGSAQSEKPFYVKSGVKGNTKILFIVEEGYRITKEDIDNKKLLVRLDSSDLEDRLLQQEIQYQNAKASLSKAQQDYEIQEKQNDADIKEAERGVKFMGMDLQKYLGEDLANALIADIDLARAADLAEEAADAANLAERTAEGAAELARAAKERETERTLQGDAEGESPRRRERGGGRRAEGGEITPEMRRQFMEARAARADTAAPSVNGEAASLQPRAEDLEHAAREAAHRAAEARRIADDAAAAFETALKSAGRTRQQAEDGRRFYTPPQEVNFRTLAEDKRLGGAAAQTRDKHDSDILLGEEELITAQRNLEGTQKLFDKEFVTETELIRDRMAVTRNTIDLENKRTSKRLFVDYEFPKLAEEAYAKYEDALLVLDRTLKQAQTKLLNASVALETASRQFEVQERQRRENQEQLARCEIIATREGIVVYGDSSSGGRGWRGDQPLGEGAAVHENMVILTIPDINQMAISVQIHESAIKKVEVGKPAKIRVEAYPNEILTGTVSKVAVVPSSENRWLNPDLKIYPTTISIAGVYEWLKPGMTAEVEIQIETLENVLYVPLQAVGSRGNERIVYLSNGQPRPVQTGEFNEFYIEIKNGLAEGDTVLLQAPGETKAERNGEEREGGEETLDVPAAS